MLLFSLKSGATTQIVVECRSKKNLFFQKQKIKNLFIDPLLVPTIEGDQWACGKVA